MNNPLNVSIITIGDELLIGQVIDSNSAIMGQMLSAIGLAVSRRWCIADKREEILYAMQEASRHSDLVLITGGLGPTKDDITKKVIAEFLGVELKYNEQAYTHLKEILDRYKVEIRDMHVQQCWLPSNAQILDNKLGTAVGLWMEHRGIHWVVMPGVPYEMEYIMKHGVIPRISKFELAAQYRQTTVLTAGIGESEIAHQIEPLLTDMPNYIQLAYLPGTGMVRLRLSGNHESTSMLENELLQYVQIIKNRLGDFVLGTDDQNLSWILGQMLKDRNLWIGTAESCTGGMMAQMITAIPGSSAYFCGSAVTYSETLKKNILGVQQQTLTQYGVVSEQTVREMVKGACMHLEVDLAVASTGIAGPDGGTVENPVGTIWIAAGNRDHVLCQKLQLGKDRTRNIERAATMGLLLARKWLLQDMR
ncbi:MAG: CinA family nicotinamide mononucleotide deamidase-related protein [Saprospiraceae bacterium]|nr:CinA family nicotinamide mononucleotide deamidase-related protein [Saprospiraceae bacterium]